MAFYRESQGSILVIVNGVSLPSDSWATMDGGDAAASSTKTRPGGMAPQVELGGQVSRSDLTVTRQWSDALIAAYYSLDSVAGHANASVTYTPLNADKSLTHQPSFTYTGVLLTVTRPNVSAEVDSASFLSLLIGANETMSSHTN